MLNFAITGVAGYIAPRHLKAIQATGNNLIAAVDPNDSVGILDSYFPETSFFTEIERFDRHLEKLRRKGDANKIDYMTICSPNHLHDAHIRLALRLGADAICEKPLVLNPWNLDQLSELESDYGKKVYTILQLRVHPALVALKEKLRIKNSEFRIKHEVVLTYITARGIWYNYSWKGDPHKSGGIATNIGVHFFDLLIWLFGKPVRTEVHLSEFNKMAGFIELENANVKWYLSIDGKDLNRLEAGSEKLEVRGEKRETSNEKQVTSIGNQSNEKQVTSNENQELVTRHASRVTAFSLRTHRSIRIDGDEIEFTEGFTDLHTVVYTEILDGKGFSIEDSRSSIELVHQLRNEKVTEKIDLNKKHWMILSNK